VEWGIYTSTKHAEGAKLNVSRNGGWNASIQGCVPKRQAMWVIDAKQNCEVNEKKKTYGLDVLLHRKMHEGFLPSNLHHWARDCPRPRRKI
jgi:hypothetical protein